jgi:nucleoside recognition membrane protein YjiH
MNVNMKSLDTRSINRTWNSMDNTWKMVGLTVVAAAALFYPAMRLYSYIMQRRQNSRVDNQEHTNTVKAFSPTYRSHLKPHRRKVVETDEME